MNAVLETPSTPAAPRSPRPATERTFVSHDGTALFYRAWLPADRATRAVVLFHRGHEHSGRWTEFVDQIGPGDDTAVFAWDARGHGRSPGERGWAPDFATVIKDADRFVNHVCAEHSIAIEDVAVVAHSVGAVLAAAWVHDYAPPIRALVLATPALKVKLYVPLAIPSLRALSKVKKKSFVTSYVRSKMLTHDPEQAAAYDADPLISKQIAVNILLDLHDVSKRLIDDAGAIDTPTLILNAGSDWVVNNGAATKFFERLSSPVKECHTYPGMGHAIFHEQDRGQVVDRVRSFLEKQFAKPHSGDLVPVHSFTRREYDKLAKPRSAACPKGWMYKTNRLSMKTVCRLSEGVRLGWRAGFDSGQSLDYVYRNRPAGTTPLGRLIDYFYLNAIGWRGIRQRKVHLEKTLRDAVARVTATGQSPRLVDVASGPGRYMLELLKSLPDARATLRDCRETELAEGRRLAAELGVANVTYEQGDAFSSDELDRLDPRPNIAVVSGLYELFPDNALIQQSLLCLTAALEPGGYLVYTNQPWHPQVEFIARVLDNRDGKPWIMRRRTQREMDTLVRQAGFEKISQEIDQWGVFSVSLARKVTYRPGNLKSESTSS